MLSVIVMVEAKAVVDDTKIGKKSKEGKRGIRRWAWVGALVVLMMAIAITSKHAQNHKSCQCSQVLLFLLILYLFCVIFHGCDWDHVH